MVVVVFDTVTVTVDVDADANSDAVMIVIVAAFIMGICIRAAVVNSSLSLTVAFVDVDIRIMPRYRVGALGNRLLLCQHSRT